MVGILQKWSAFLEMVGIFGEMVGVFGEMLGISGEMIIIFLIIPDHSILDHSSLIIPSSIPDIVGNDPVVANNPHQNGQENGQHFDM